MQTVLAPTEPGPSTEPAAVDLLIVGGGPAGLAAAVEARRLGCSRVVVVDREAELGGIPRHADHIGFGIRDLHRLLTGPAYARRYVDMADHAGVTLRPGTTVTDLDAASGVHLSSAAGGEQITARAIILATGCRERPRPARLVPGDRPPGIFTTGSLQQLVYLQRQRLPGRAVVVGAEHVSCSAVLTLRHAGASVSAMVTEHARHQTYAPYKWLSATRHRVPILTRHRIARINGKAHLESVDIDDLRTGARRTVPCDILVFTGDWIPDHELARRAQLAIDPGTRAPRIDAMLRTSMRGVFAAGNLVHPAETADVAALGGRHAAHAAAAFLQRGGWPERRLPILCTEPIAWIAPNVVCAERNDSERAGFTWRVSRVLTHGNVQVEQSGRPLWSQRYRALRPTLPHALPPDWTRRVDLEGEPLVFRLYTG